MASAQFVSNVGGWMQTVGAQQLMLTLTTSATLVALIQTAAALPIALRPLTKGSPAARWSVVAPRPLEAQPAETAVACRPQMLGPAVGRPHRGGWAGAHHPALR